MNDALNTALSVQFSPVISNEWLLGFTVIASILFILSLFIFRKGLIWRSVAATIIFSILCAPVIVEKQRQSVKNTVVIVEDASLSQQFDKRNDITKKTIEHIRSELDSNDDFDVRYIKGPKSFSSPHDKTNLFGMLDEVLADIPVDRRAGVAFVTDGQVHDIPQTEDKLAQYGPIHVLLTGRKTEQDRRLEIIDAPAYGMVDENVTVTYKIVDTDNMNQNTAYVTIRHNDKPATYQAVPVGAEQTTTFKIDRGGQNIIDIEVDAVKDEITESNNRIPLIVNGIRNRLKVLLVSGVPHTGGRTWRNLLTADPGVDLVHFTILRDPSKMDSTPQNELSLIAFPFRELFEIKLYDFDLIIFDRYQLNHILPSYYFNNIAKYVENGGAFLAANGPAFTSEQQSIYTTALQNILPAKPQNMAQNSIVINEKFTPAITEKGNKHPVTRNLSWDNTLGLDNSSLTKTSTSNEYDWGPWLRQIPVQQTGGHVLMDGINNLPLLILNRVGEGRVAQISSDHIWLWSRGYMGGGPQADLLRRLAHWLMKEPDLEETALYLKTSGNTIRIERRTLDNRDVTVIFKKPDGTQETFDLKETEPGLLTKTIKAQGNGVYSVTDGAQTRFALVGNLNAPENKDVLSSDEKFQKALYTSNGKSIYVRDTLPNIRAVNGGLRYGGRNWIGFKNDESYIINGVTQKDFLPPWAYLAFILFALVGMWWLESRTKKAN